MTTTKKGAKSAKLETAKASVKSGAVMTAAEMTTTAAQVAEQAVQTKTAKQQAAQEKRDWLRAISADFQAQREFMELTGADYIPTINEMLHAYYAKQNNITELNTFDQWKEKGYQVRRGEKAFLFWGKPRRKESQRLTEDPERTGVKLEDATEEQILITKSDTIFYPLCYLFDISQCHKANV